MPYFRSPWWLNSEDHQIFCEGDFEKNILDELEKKGQKIKELTQSELTVSGYWSGIYIDPKSNLLQGATSSGLNGNVEGY